jgi:hypothetical protein
MKQRIVWLVVGGLALVALWALIKPASAQRDGGFGFPLLRAGRFTVAHASADAVLVLDTATGKVYKAGKDDFKKMSELPKIEEGARPVFPKEREKKDGDVPPRRKERDRDPEKKVEREKAEEAIREARKEAAEAERRAQEARDAERRARQAQEEQRRKND